MLNVLFDLEVAQPKGKAKYHGGGEYTKSIYSALYEYIDGISMYVIYDSSLFIDEWIVKSFVHENIHVIDVALNNRSLLISNINRLDVFFEGLVSPKQKRKIVIPKECISIGVYHGLRTLEILPGGDRTEILYMEKLFDIIKYYLKRMRRTNYFDHVRLQWKEQLEKYDYLIGASMHSVYSLKMFFPELKEKKIDCFYSAPKYKEDTEEAIHISDNNVILLLNSDRWIKNAFRGIKALDLLFSEGQLDGFTVHLTGVLPKSIRKRIVNKERFLNLGYISTEELEREYSSCHLFFYPTLNEGFGYPPIEAMKYGKTCLISCNSSLPELFAGYVYFCNPLDINEMKTRLLMACENPLPMEDVISRYNEIRKRQLSDTNKVIELILSCNERSTIEMNR